MAASWLERHKAGDPIGGRVRSAIEVAYGVRIESSLQFVGKHVIVQGGLQPRAPFFVPYLVKVLESELHESARLVVYDMLTELAMGVASDHAHTQFSFRTSPFVHIIPDESSPPVFIELVTRLLIIQNVATYAKDIAYSSDAVRVAASALLATFTGYAGLLRYVLSPYVNELPHSSVTRSDICRLMNSLR